MKNYNSVEGIQEYLSAGLDGLHELIQNRREAGYKRGERLQEFIVNGCFWFDTCGNVMSCKFALIDDHSVDVSWLRKFLPPAITRSQLGSTIPSLSTEGSSGVRIPHSDDKCEGCGKGWRLENVSDARRAGEDVYGERDGIPTLVKRAPLMHVACFRLKREAETLTEFANLAEKSGFSNPVLASIPNEYWKDDEFGPWVELKTHMGSIKIGWRKRVINLDWSDIVERKLKGALYERREHIRNYFDSETLFKDEDVTKGKYYIHAWGHDKLVTYLQTLHRICNLFDVW